MSDKNCTYWSDSEHFFILIKVDDRQFEGPITSKTKFFNRKVCKCGTFVKSREELKSNTNIR